MSRYSIFPLSLFTLRTADSFVLFPFFLCTGTQNIHERLPLRAVQGGVTPRCTAQCRPRCGTCGPCDRRKRGQRSSRDGTSFPISSSHCSLYDRDIIAHSPTLPGASAHQRNPPHSAHTPASRLIIRRTTLFLTPTCPATTLTRSTHIPARRSVSVPRPSSACPKPGSLAWPRAYRRFPCATPAAKRDACYRTIIRYWCWRRTFAVRARRAWSFCTCGRRRTTPSPSTWAWAWARDVPASTCTISHSLITWVARARVGRCAWAHTHAHASWTRRPDARTHHVAASTSISASAFALFTRSYALACAQPCPGTSAWTRARTSALAAASTCAAAQSPAARALPAPGAAAGSVHEPDPDAHNTDSPCASTARLTPARPAFT